MHPDDRVRKQANRLPGRAAWQDLIAPEVWSDAGLAVDPGRLGRGRRWAVRATARADLRGSAHPHLQTARRYRDGNPNL